LKTKRIIDLFLGVEYDLPEGWAAYYNLETRALNISNLLMPFKGYAIAVYNMPPREAINFTLNNLNKVLSNQSSGFMMAAPPKITSKRVNDEIHVTRIDIITGQILRMYGLNPSGEQLISNIIAKPIPDRRITIIYNWIYPLSLSSTSPTAEDLAEYISNIKFIGRTIRSSGFAIKDMQSGVNAIIGRAPQGWMYNGNVDMYGNMMIQCSYGEASFICHPIQKFIQMGRFQMFMNPFIMQYYNSLGYNRQNYMNAMEYLNQLVARIGGKVIEVFKTAPPQMLTFELLNTYMQAKMMNQHAEIDSIIAIVEINGKYSAFWITTYGGELPMGAFMGISIFPWYAHVISVSGLNNPELALNFLNTMTSHLVATQEWIQTLFRRKQKLMQQMIQQARRNIREQSAMWERIRRSIRSSSFPTYRSTWTPPSSDYSQESSISDVLGSLWTSDEERSESNLSDYDWGGGQGTFYVDSDGHIRSMDYGEEIVADHIDSAGYIYDSEGREIGRIDEGYIYDNEGYQVGRLDTGMSDDWQLEKYEQEFSDAEHTLGYDMFGANYDESSDSTPFHVTKMRRELDEDEY